MVLMIKSGKGQWRYWQWYQMHIEILEMQCSLWLKTTTISSPGLIEKVFVENISFKIEQGLQNIFATLNP